MKKRFRAVLSITVTKAIHQFIYQQEHYNQVIAPNHFKSTVKCLQYDGALIAWKKNVKFIHYKYSKPEEIYTKTNDVNTSRIGYDNT